MQFLFDITEEKINDMPVEDFEALEMAQDGDPKIYKIRRVMCHFLVDEDHKEVPYETALKITSKLKLPEMKSFVEQFTDAMKAKAVPKANRSPLSSPSQANMVDSSFQTG